MFAFSCNIYMEPDEQSDQCWALHQTLVKVVIHYHLTVKHDFYQQQCLHLQKMKQQNKALQVLHLQEMRNEIS